MINHILCEFRPQCHLLAAAPGPIQDGGTLLYRTIKDHCMSQVCRVKLSQLIFKTCLHCELVSACWQNVKRWMGKMRATQGRVHLKHAFTKQVRRNQSKCSLVGRVARERLAISAHSRRVSPRSSKRVDLIGLIAADQPVLWADFSNQVRVLRKCFGVWLFYFKCRDMRCTQVQSPWVTILRTVIGGVVKRLPIRGNISGVHLSQLYFLRIFVLRN